MIGTPAHVTAPPASHRSRQLIEVLVADAQPLYRDAVARVVRQQRAFQLVGEHDEGRAALAAIAALRPRVAVLDAALTGLTGPRVVRAVARDRLPTSVILMAAELSPEAAYAALAEGAAGLLSKAATAAQLEAAIRSAARGEVVIAPALQTAVAAQIRLRRPDAGPVLSPREGEVLELMAAGLSGPEMGRALHLGAATVKTHVANLYAKLGVSDRGAAVAQAMRAGLLE